ncbi:Phox domain-containing protein [Chaetomium fimeti]|uniref:Endosomal/vacuolar adapter protein YPT35 n=1 Tax=Chaetomium fimeti TaxID=1854472 RepID=A0AAE0LX61_9PEZI|nr:Phox homologous domain-containing protein [Chaetomium fimeti]
MAPNNEQDQHPPQPAHREPPPDPLRNGNPDNNHPADGEGTSIPPSPPQVNGDEPAPSRAALFPSDSASETSIPSTTAEAEDEEGDLISPSASIPPYWSSARAAEQLLLLQQQQHNNNHNNPLRPHGHAPGHARGASSASVESVLPPGAITLQDNEEEDDGEDEEGGSNRGNGNGNGNGGEHAGRRSNSSEVYGRDRNRACWARSVQVTDPVVVNGSATNIGAFVVWNIKVEALNGSRINIRKRYSEFDDLRRRLVQTFPGFEAAVPALPPKSVLKRFHPRFLEKRRAGLQYFLNCILLNPEFSGSPVLKEFLFS